MRRKRHIAAENMQLLGEVLNLLEGIDPKLYAASLAYSESRTVGEHFRACLDAYACFLKGNDTGNVDYGARVAPERVAHDLVDAIALTRRTIRALEELPDEAYFTVHVKAASGKHGSDAGYSRSSVLREMQFLAALTAQHFALISLALRFHGADTPSLPALLRR
jgi:hypothetical protein